MTAANPIIGFCAALALVTLTACRPAETPAPTPDAPPRAPELSQGEETPAGHEHGRIEIPETFEDLWAAIQSTHARTAQALEAGDLDAVHHLADDLENLVIALPAKTSGLPAARQTRVEGQAGNLVRVLDALHHAAEEGDQPEAEEKFKTATDLLNLLEAQLEAPGN